MSANLSSPTSGAILMFTEAEWYKKYGVSHAHCPNGCEHPQPFIFDEKLICGRCFHKWDEIVTMTPCTPETCEE